ncbi:cysteine proteinase [Fistulina hepatica ATCC 64428]|uniref:ubiquitinyl hydrolase 1 n=1 Tax=Fistulina hepatica ATCC 64428 TaxID=1128425 RepID=A0A0D7A5C3_9AGAR|nr:cysteine proteinase [Fistulina hepatica ATCC 64428]
MAKQKRPTAQELYFARKDREEKERSARLPPGLINHGNSCFMNSVLQGLIATPLLSDLVQFLPLSRPHLHAILPQRSPQLTNGREQAGEYMQPPVDDMPVGDVFLTMMLKAWDAQAHLLRESMSPKPLLSTLGRKYDQYLDFTQQDAHEFLRILLDAMRMEEFDVIKRRQPPPSADKHRRRRKTITPPVIVAEKDTPISFVDMIFGGKLASILVCQKCNHVSQTYEDFNDLSLSIKPEDYTMPRRERLKRLAKRITTFGTSQRPSSVPPLDRQAGEDSDDDTPVVPDEPRRSLELLRAPDADAEQSGQEDDDDDEEKCGNDKHKKSRSADGWVKLGRRISTTMGLARSSLEPSKERQSHARSRNTSGPSSSLATFGAGTDDSASAVNLENLPAITLSRVSESEPLANEFGRYSRSKSPPLPRAQSNSKASSVTRFSSRPSSKTRASPSMSPAKAAYLDRILADVPPTSSSPFSLFGSSSASFARSGSSQQWFKSSENGINLWLKTAGHLQSVEECLRAFTAVEVLDGENMVRCRRCWKIAHGLYHPQTSDGNANACTDDDGSDSDTGDESSGSNGTPASTLSDSWRPVVTIPTSISSPVIGAEELDRPSGDGRSVSSLPMFSTESTGSASSETYEDIMAIASPKRSSEDLPSTSFGHQQTVRLVQRDDTLRSTDRENTIRSPPLFAPQLRLASKSPTSDATDENSEYESDASVSARALNSESPHPPPDATSPVTYAPQAPPHQQPPSQIKKKKERVMKCPAYKRYLIATPPPILVVHLKRFQQVSKSNVISFSSGFKKLDDYVSFPLLLDLTPYLAPNRADYRMRDWECKGKGKANLDVPPPEPCLYRLYAVVVHIGSMLGGHYIAYTALPPPADKPGDEAGERASPDVVEKHEPVSAPGGKHGDEKHHTHFRHHSHAKAPVDDRQWAYISDTVVKLTTLEEVLKARAYLFDATVLLVTAIVIYDYHPNFPPLHVVVSTIPQPAFFVILCVLDGIHAIANYWRT